jgi:hypothetical protein
MQVTIPFEYTAEEIPPKCRKAREVRKEGSVVVNIAEITSEQAPVAFIGSGEDHKGEYKREYRWYDGCLWLLGKDYAGPDEEQKIQTAEEFLAAQANSKSHGAWYVREEKNRAGILDWAGTIVFIDGLRWDLTMEPEYKIRESFNWTSLDIVFGEKHEIGDPSYYRIDQLEEALQHIETLHGGDVEGFSRFEILLPTALRLPATPKQDTFTVTVTLEVEARGLDGAAREFASTLGISRFNARDVSFTVSNPQTGEQAEVKLPAEC